MKSKFRHADNLLGGAKMAKFEKLFEPIKIGKVSVRNRIAMPPMVVAYAGPNSEVTDQLIS